jgi:hypothetical protein
MIAAGAGSATVIAAMKPSKSLVDLPTEARLFPPFPITGSSRTVKES